MKVSYKRLFNAGTAIGILVLAWLLSACGGDSSLPASASNGKQLNGIDLYQQNCATCHGPDGKGRPNLGKDLTTSQLLQGQSDQVLLAFIKQGRMPNEPENTTGVPMPPKGGNPALTDEQILDIIAYIRMLK